MKNKRGMTNPMSAEEIVSKWCKEPPYDFGTVTATEVQMYEMEKQAVRQALASHLAYVMGKVEKHRAPFDLWKERFRAYKLEEYGKWKIGRAEAEAFIAEERKAVARDVLERMGKALGFADLPKEVFLHKAMIVLLELEEAYALNPLRGESL